MNKKYKQKALKFIKVGKEDQVIGKFGNKILLFSRANEEDIKNIEKLSNEELLNEAIGLTWMIENVGHSIRDLQIEELYSMEIASRGLNKEARKRWNKIKDEKIE